MALLCEVFAERHNAERHSNSDAELQIRERHAVAEPEGRKPHPLADGRSDSYLDDGPAGSKNQLLSPITRSRKHLTAEVCSKPAGNSTHGLCDMAGNVANQRNEVETEAAERPWLQHVGRPPSPGILASSWHPGIPSPVFPMQTLISQALEHYPDLNLPAPKHLSRRPSSFRYPIRREIPIVAPRFSTPRFRSSGRLRPHCPSRSALVIAYKDPCGP